LGDDPRHRRHEGYERHSQCRRRRDRSGVSAPGLSAVPVEIPWRRCPDHGFCCTVGSGNPWLTAPSTGVPPPGRCPGAWQALPCAHRAHVYAFVPSHQVAGEGRRHLGMRAGHADTSPAVGMEDCPAEIPHLRTSRRTRSMRNPLAFRSRSLMQGLQRFTCRLRPPCVTPSRVRFLHHRCTTTRAPHRFLPCQAIAVPSTEISCTAGDLTSISRRISQRCTIIARCIHACIVLRCLLYST
jgi:hypothetical protein